MPVLPAIQPGVRRVAVILFGLFALIGASGLTEAHLFHQASTLKYGITVAGPLIVSVLLVLTTPLMWVVSLLVLAAPFAGLSMSPGGVHVPLLAPIFVLAIVTVDYGSDRRRRSALALAGVGMVLALVLPLVQSPGVASALQTVVSLLLGAFLAARVAAQRSGVLVLMWSFLASAALQAAIALWELRSGHPLNLYGSAGAQSLTGSGGSYFFTYAAQTRPPGAFYDPISLGNLLALTIPMGVGLLVRSVRARQWTRVAAAAAGVALVTVALEETLSRMSWIAAVVGLLVMFAFVPTRLRRRGMAAVAVAALLLVAFGVLSTNSTVGQRLGSIANPLNETGTGNGDQARVFIWGRALSVFAAHPIAGVGLNRFQLILEASDPTAGTQAHAHSTYLQIAADGGLIALAGLGLVGVALVRDMRRLVARQRAIGAVLAGSCVALAVCWLTDVTIRYSGVATLMGALFGMVAGASRRARADEPLA